MRVGRAVAGVAAVTLVLSLGGHSAGYAAPDPAVAFLTADAGLGYVREMTAGYATAVAEAGVRHTEAGPPIGDTARQLGMLEDLRREGRNGLAVFTWTPELLSGPMAATGEAGTPVIAVYSPPAEGSGVKLYVGNDNFALGEMLADQVASLLPRDAAGVVVLGTAVPGVQALDQRIAGLRSRLPRVRPGVRLLGPFDTKQDPAANLKSWELLVRSDPRALGFVGTGDRDARSLARLRNQSAGTWIAGGFGLDDIAVQAVRNGGYALVSPEPYVQGAIAGWLLAEHAKRNFPLPAGWIPTPAIPVTPSNAEMIMARQASTKRRADDARVVVRDVVSDLAGHLLPLSAAR
ncbi:substrate-binding domain-containing protein [Actinoplanes sp. NPDC089786]|uniref:sugar ABC transporter substrate-binding protein n=1 Tax=Actinoplanes sp. NPDC089786 TaxID=3155185 RepID=UPI0034144698